MKVVVCGDRDWPKWRRNSIIRVLSRFADDTLVITDMNSGVGAVAHEIAVKMGYRTQIVESEELIAQAPELVIVFHADVMKSPATIDVVAAAMKQKIEVKLFTH